MIAPHFTSSHLMLPPSQPSPPLYFTGMQHSVAAHGHQGLRDAAFTVDRMIVQASDNVSVRSNASNNANPHILASHQQVLQNSASLYNSHLHNGDVGVSALHDSNFDQISTALPPAVEQHRATSQSSTSASIIESTDEAQMMQAGDPSVIDTSFEFDESIDWNDPAILDGFSGDIEHNTFTGAGRDLSS